ncbi:helix-turn-helix domain-containing protein [Burkholderia sp. Bmkn7]|uniref:helix-turn-helix domain-containing protein n=1 Tax=Burkholderia sp. Bmkn7 TaxID=3236841 RepID=UPI0034E552C1
MNPTRLRDQLYTLRKQAGLTQTELAELLHIDQSNLSKIERGSRSLDVFGYIDWCRACGVSPTNSLADLLGSTSLDT